MNDLKISSSKEINDLKNSSSKEVNDLKISSSKEIKDLSKLTESTLNTFKNDTLNQYTRGLEATLASNAAANQKLAAALTSQVQELKVDNGVLREENRRQKS